MISCAVLLHCCNTFSGVRPTNLQVFWPHSFLRLFISPTCSSRFFIVYEFSDEVETDCKRLLCGNGKTQTVDFTHNLRGYGKFIVHNHNSPAWAGTGLLHTSGKVLSKLVLGPWHSPFLPPAAAIALIFHPPLLTMQPFEQKGILSNLKCKN